MHETARDLEELQRLLDVSFAGSGEHLRSAFGQDQRLSADALVSSLPGLFEIHLAVVTTDGSPLVAPVDGFLLHGRICLGLPVRSVRARLLHRDPRVSVSLNTEAVAFIAHGTFVEVAGDHPFLEAFDDTSRRLYIEQYGEWFDGWLDRKLETEGRGVTGFVQPRVLFARGAAT